MTKGHSYGALWLYTDTLVWGPVQFGGIGVSDCAMAWPAVLLAYSSSGLLPW